MSKSGLFVRTRRIDTGVYSKDPDASFMTSFATTSNFAKAALFAEHCTTPVVNYWPYYCPVYTHSHDHVRIPLMRTCASNMFNFSCTCLELFNFFMHLPRTFAICLYQFRIASHHSPRNLACRAYGIGFSFSARFGFPTG